MNENLTFSDDISFYSMLNSLAVKYKEEPAFSYIENEKEFTVLFSGLWQDVQRLSRNFIDFKGKLVLLYAKGSYAYIAVFFALISIGCIAVPINCNYREEQLSDLKNSCDFAALVYSAETALDSKKLTDFFDTSQIFEINDIFTNSQMPVNSISEYCETDKPCCIIYTSGSNGIPKGVQLSQRNIITDSIAFAEAVPVKGSVISCLPLHHMYAWVSSIIAPLICGQKIILNHDNVMIGRDLQYFSPVNFVAVPEILEFYKRRILFRIKKHRNSRIYLQLLESTDILQLPAEERRKRFSEVTSDLGKNLEYMFSGAAALLPETVDFFDKIGITVLSAYGLTECSPAVSVERLDSRVSGSVGLPLKCNKVKIDSPDENGIGEILISGSNVMLGYYKNIEETEKIIVSGWLHSGDKGYFDDSGNLYITGRIKNIIVRASGENVSPEELEKKLMQYSNLIREIIVCEENELLKAIIYLENNTEQNQKFVLDIVEKFNTNLPSYSRINITEFRNEPFEKTSTMKIKRSSGGK